MSTQPHTFLTPEQYLEIERKAEYKSEFYNGEMFAMPGGSRRHNALGHQLHGLTWQHLRSRRYEAYTSDMRVFVPGSGLYTYPDFSVVCGEPQFTDAAVDTLLNPTFIAEILSPSTEQYDRGKKLRSYRTIPSLQECLLISQELPEVELYRRAPDGTWSVIDASGRDASIELTSIQYTLHLRELYDGILPPD